MKLTTEKTVNNRKRIYTNTVTSISDSIGGINKTNRKKRGIYNRKSIDKQVSTFVDKALTKDRNKAFKSNRATNQKLTRIQKRQKNIANNLHS